MAASRRAGKVVMEERLVSLEKKRKLELPAAANSAMPI